MDFCQRLLKLKKDKFLEKSRLSRKFNIFSSWGESKICLAFDLIDNFHLTQFCFGFTVDVNDDINDDDVGNNDINDDDIDDDINVDVDNDTRSSLKILDNCYKASIKEGLIKIGLV